MRVPVTDLVGKPGSTRPLRRAVDPSDIGEPGDDWGPAEGAILGPVILALTLEAVVEGILVRGTVDVDLELPCSRCLEPQRVEHTAAVAELFLDPRRVEAQDDEDSYRIDDDLAHLDLTAMLHDTVIMEIPVQLLCQEACAGLCPVCGANLNETDCGHRPEQAPDPRWARLADLDLPPG